MIISLYLLNVQLFFFNSSTKVPRCDCLKCCLLKVNKRILTAQQLNYLGRGKLNLKFAKYFTEKILIVWILQKARLRVYATRFSIFSNHHSNFNWNDNVEKKIALSQTTNEPIWTNEPSHTVLDNKQTPIHINRIMKWELTPSSTPKVDGIK